MSLTPDPELADVLIVNTCSFIDMAKQESIDAIFDAVDDRARRSGPRAPENHRRRLPVPTFRQGTARHHAGGGRLHRPRPDHQGRADHREPARQEERRRGPENRRPVRHRGPARFRHAQAAIRPGLRHPALPPHAGPFRLRQDRRGLQPHLHLLHHPENPRPAPLAAPRIASFSEVEALVEIRREGDQPHLPGHHLLRHGPVGRQAPDTRARPSIPPAANRSPPCSARSTRSKATSGSACSTPTPRIGATNSSRPSPSATRSRNTSTSRSSTSPIACSPP